MNPADQQAPQQPSPLVAITCLSSRQLAFHKELESMVTIYYYIVTSSILIFVIIFDVG
jgi:hypothetical protein